MQDILFCLNDAIRFANIDSMHNVFLGTAKHVMVLWKDKNILTKEHFLMIQERIENISVPMDIGRIPYKIESAMAGLTADQWKNWTCIYSLYVLHDILPDEHLHLWWLFVQASCIVCQPMLSHNNISLMDNFFPEFCQEFERLFGPEACTINLHLHCHLADCLRDYGPSQSTWCFSFERLNGILGNTPTNMKNLQIEKTLVNRFVQQVEMCSTNTELLSELKDFFPHAEMGSVNDSAVNSESYIKQLQLSKTQDLTDLLTYTEHELLIEPVGKISQQVLDSYEVAYLKDMYESIFSSQQNLLLEVTCLYHQFERVKVADKMLSSKRAKSDHSSFVAARWFGRNASINVSQPNPCRPGKIFFFLKHRITIQSNNKTNTYCSLLAFVGWYKIHPEKDYLLSPITLWSPDYEPIGPASFIPISRIAYRCAQVQKHMEFRERSYNNGQTVIIVPINKITDFDC